MRLVVVSLTIVLLLGCAAPSRAQLFDPAYRFRAVQTEHFVIYFHQGEDRLAARLATIAEDVWRTAGRPLGVTPPSRTHVVLVDQTDVSNGWATVVPRDTIAIYAVWPTASDTLRTDDWLRVVFTHEFTHILHLDRSRGWGRPVRAVFGRVPIAFPNLFLPVWQIEGIATYQESVLTGEGRLHAGDFLAVVAEDARAGRPEPLDRVNGGQTSWPAGRAPYAYGLGFHAFLSERFGPQTLAALADATARRLPYFGSRAFKRVYGRSLGSLWREYRTGLLAARSESSVPDAATRLTHHQYLVTGPRAAPRTCSSCPIDIYYTMRNADEFPSLYRLRGDAGATGQPDRVTRRSLGSTIAPGREKVYFDQAELRRNAGLYSDLYALDRASGRVVRLTRDARLIDPDLSPDGRTLVAAQIQPGQRNLVLARLSAPDVAAEVVTLVASPEMQFNTPRWAPDGRTVAAQRQQLGGQPEIVIVDVETKNTRAIASGNEWRWVTPAWRPDGQAIVAAGARGDDPFNLYEIRLSDLSTRPLTRTSGGATWPDVSADGTSIVFVGYSADGFDLYRMTYPTGGTTIAVSPARPVTPSSSAPALPTQPRSYSPWRTLSPTSWEPLLYSRDDHTYLGASTAGSDVLAYHAYFASVAFRTSGPDTGKPGFRDPDWDVAYAYTRWRPVLFGSASAKSYFSTEPETGIASTTTRRRYELEAGLTVPVVHTRVTHNALVSFVLKEDRVTAFDGGEWPLDRSAMRAGWSLVSAHQFGNSISPERGAAVGATFELNRRSLGSFADAESFGVDARAYLPGMSGHHVSALRFAAARTSGDSDVGRQFVLGGSAASERLIDFDSDALGLLRGFEDPSFAGTRLLVFNADYRWPLLQVERGHGTWPLFVHTIHAAVFADLGHVWSRQFSARAMKRSAGGELSFKLVAGYTGLFSVTLGAARIHDGAGFVPDATRGYIRIGRAF